MWYQSHQPYVTNPLTTVASLFEYTKKKDSLYFANIFLHFSMWYQSLFSIRTERMRICENRYGQKKKKNCFGAPCYFRSCEGEINRPLNHTYVQNACVFCIISIFFSCISPCGCISACGTNHTIVRTERMRKRERLIGP